MHSNRSLKTVKRDRPCPHCGKPDWCYQLGELTVCKRDAEPAPGWKLTSLRDREGSYYYAPINPLPKPIRPKQTRTWEYPSRDHSPFVRVIRIDDGQTSKPKRWQEHWDRTEWVKGLQGIDRADIPIYRYTEIQTAIADGKPIFLVEGEVCADALWNLGIPATTNIGGAGKWKPSDSNDLKGAKVVLCPDRDQPGLAHMDAIAQDFPDAQWLYAFPTSDFWNRLPASGGADVADWIADYQLSAAHIWEACEPRRTQTSQPQLAKLTPPVVEENYTQLCVKALYSDTAWVAFHGKLYKWVGTHYQETCSGEEIQRITQWCHSTPVRVGKTWKYSYATATHVDNIIQWLHRHFSISPRQVNPPGINCRNGVVKLKWQGNRAIWELIPHNPDVVYTYISDIEFQPHADPTECDRMLNCLEPTQQKLFIQTIAASLDLDTIRRYRGRTVKALLCRGHGNNGKDTLREALRLLYGIGMSDATISDFASYDSGRKFDLSKLQDTRINWSSENSSIENLDRIQSLKQAITGESLDLERKGMDVQPMRLSTVFLFNVNEAPNLQAGLEAIQSRWSVLSFNKTYKVNADPKKGELEADSRFRYDSDFLKKQVCPALLNKMLEAIATLAIDGIDYSHAEQALQNIQQETNHLWAFAREVGLDYRLGGRVYINDLWEILQTWYTHNGTLEVSKAENGKEKKIWHDQPRRGDKNVKAPNQIHQRFAELFPKIQRCKNNDASEGVERKGQFYLSGISITNPSEKQWRSTGEAIGEAVILAQSQGEAREAIYDIQAEIYKMAQSLSSGQRQELIAWLTQTHENSRNLSE
jgi:putative DNA primase/helicase